MSIAKINPDFEYHGDEVHQLLDLVQNDGRIHDLDQFEPEHMQSTFGIVLCELMWRLERSEGALLEVVKDHDRRKLAGVNVGECGEMYAKIAKDVLSAIE